MQKRTIIGVDPGHKGAVAVFEPGGNLAIWDLKDFLMPTGGFNSLDPVRFADAMRNAIDDTGNAVAFCEESLLIHGNGIKTARPIFDSRGVLRSVFALLRVELRFIPPAMWKRFYGLQKTEKADSVNKAVELIPRYADFFRKQYRGRTLDLDGRAEAALIGLFGTRSER